MTTSLPARRRHAPCTLWPDVSNPVVSRGAGAAREGADVARRTDQRAHAAARQSRDWLVPLGRAGFAANGLVYLLVGVLSAQAALGVGGETTDPEGALVHIIQAPFGKVALALVAIGLAGYAIWRLLQAVLDSDQKGTDPAGLAARIGFGVSGVVYLGLATSAVGLLLGTAGGDSANGDQAAQDKTAFLLNQPFGRWLLAIVGLIVIGAGVAQIVSAWRATFRRQLDDGELDRNQRDGITWIGRLGYAARGVVLWLVGVFVIVAAVQGQPEQARGLGGVLATLASEPFGPWLLGVVAVGLAAYGLFLLVQARYRRMVIT
jgi:Domain of Unknown Function (DUF1206)